MEKSANEMNIDEILERAETTGTNTREISVNFQQRI